jgi:hypothetical protein
MRAQEGFLHGLFGPFMAAQATDRRPQERGLVALYQIRKRRLLARQRGSDEKAVCGIGIELGHYDVLEMIRPSADPYYTRRGNDGIRTFWRSCSP